MFKRIVGTLIVLSIVVPGCAPPRKPVAEAEKRSKADATPEKTSEPESEPAVLEADLKASLDDFAKEFASAFNHRDSKLIAGLWSPTAVHVDHVTGKRSTGRGEIEQMYVDHFKGDVGEMVLVLEDAREIKPGVAKVEGSVMIVEPETSETSESRISAVFVKEKDKWLLDSVNETTTAATPESLNHLQPLAWMVGEWRDQADDVDIRSTCQWATGGGFLTRTYSITLGDDVQHQGTQVIGWDPENKTVRSWSFESDGGYGEGVWTQDGDKWTVSMRGLTPDGRRASAKQVITPVDADSYETQLISRDIDGELLPTGDVVKVTRVPTTK
jgi:uncharacterized protein (TIGR02246 family)